jgi:hypothetical protein
MMVLMAAGVAAQGKPSFAGEWKMVAATNGQGEPGVDLVITQDATSLTADYKRGGPPPAPGPLKLTFKFDGSAASKATWAGNNIVATTTTAAGEERRTFSMEGGDLIVETSASARKGATPTVTKVTYKRYERGFGG